MTLSNTNFQTTGTTDGVTSAYNFTWPLVVDISDPNSMVGVYLNGAKQVLGTNYTLSTNAATSGLGGTVQFVVAGVNTPPTTGQAWLIQREPNQFQGDSLINNRAMPPATVMRMIDKLAMNVQAALRKYVSPATTFAAGTLYTLPHLLGKVPDRLRYALVCTVAEAGYSIGDVLDITPQAKAILVAQVDMTNVYIRTLNPLTAITVPHKTTFVATALTLPADWQLIVYAS